MKFNSIIIGTGQAGPALALSLAKRGFKTAIIEKGNVGGTCINVGCTPTKSYIACARRAYVSKNSRDFGLSVKGKLNVNLEKIKKRKDKLVISSRKGLEKALTKNDNIMLYKGKAKFRDSHSVEVNGEIITANKIYINTGGRPFIPEGFENIDYLTNESMLELEKIPEHLIIIGGGYNGLEFGQMFRRFGSRVTILEKGNQLLKKEDKDISECIADILRKEGIKIRFNSECMSAKKSGKKIIVNVNCKSGSSAVSGTHLLIAAGRIPNTDDLNPEKAGIETDEKGFIKVNDVLQTNVKNIYALGDCNGQGAFTHTAYNDYLIVKSNLFGSKKRKLSDRIMCYAAYIDPPLGRVGMNENEIKRKKIKAKIAVRPMSRIARAIEKGETLGMLKIYIEDKTDKILGASFLGCGADEYIHIMIDMMYANAPYTVIRDAMHIHPTVSELIPTMLQKPEQL